MPEVIINGSEGRLEGRYHHSKAANAPIAVVLHPDPRGGGTMNNKITYALYQIFAQRGFSVLRFNFRGVGRSQGSFNRGEGELSDAASALDWLQTYNPNAAASWVAGFSFGAWIGMQLLMRRPELVSFISIAPPANMFDFTFLAPCPVSGQVIQGDADEVVPEASVAKLVHKLSNQRDIAIDYQVIPGAGHFFSDQLPQVTAAVERYVSATMAGLPAAPQGAPGRGAGLR